MFAKKQVDIFDKEVFFKERVVSYCSVNKLGDDLFQEGRSLAGIITEVTDEYIRLIQWQGETLTIYIHQVLRSPAHNKNGHRHYKIFNVFSAKELKELRKEQ
ncbi:hypothetical protein [Phage f2b1]|nr:hypothetical protein [Phage f2b1]